MPSERLIYYIGCVFSRAHIMCIVMCVIPWEYWEAQEICVTGKGFLFTTVLKAVSWNLFYI